MWFWIVVTGLIFLTLFGVFAWLIVHARTESIYRPISLVAFFASIPAMFLAFGVLLGTAMPTGYGVYKLPEGKIEILGFKSVPKVGIFLMLDSGDYKVPGYYMLPWDLETSRQLEEMGSNGVLSVEKGEGKFKLGKYEFSFDDNIPKVTADDPPEQVFSPKMEEQGVPPATVLPPSD